MSYPIDLSITGKPSPRTEHPRSAGKRSKTPLHINRTKSLQSDIFSNERDVIRTPQHAKSTVKLKEKKQEGVSPYTISKSEFESIQQLTKSKEKILEEAERKECNINGVKWKPAPIGVPRLILDEITGEDEVYSKCETDDFIETFIETYQTNNGCKQFIETYQTNNGCKQSPVKVVKTKIQTARGGGWQVSQSRPSGHVENSSTLRKHEDIPDLDLNLSRSNEGLSKLKEVVNQVDIDLHIEYLGKPKQELDHLKKLSKEKKNQLFDEAILSEQLSYCNDNQWHSVDRKFNTKLKRHNDLYSASVGTSSDGDVSKRVRFGARILTLNGHDARREINGFFVTSDNTLAMYEFRQFGTKAKALPFIQRGAYKHVTKSRRGESFHLLDISVGKNLTFESEKQFCIPGTLKLRKYITFRITDIDEESKQSLLFGKCKNDDDRKEVSDLVRCYYNRDCAEKDIVQNIQNDVCMNLKSSGGEKFLINLFYCFKNLDKTGNGLIKKDALKEALAEHRILVKDPDFETILSYIYIDENGALDYGDFIRAYVGEMSEDRKCFVRKAFSRIDPNKRGMGEVHDIQKYYCPSRHPSVLKGEVTEFQLLNEFIQCFKFSKNKTEITFSEFEAYYEGLSVGIDSDQVYINLLRMTWNI